MLEWAGASKREIDSYRLSYPPADDREQKRLGQKALKKPSYILASCLIQRPDAGVVNPGRAANLRTPFLREADGANPQSGRLVTQETGNAQNLAERARNRWVRVRIGSAKIR